MTGTPKIDAVRPGIRLLAVPTQTLPPARHTNCVFVGRSQVMVIDPAAVGEHDQQRFIAAVEKARREDGIDLLAVLLTHGHPDHIGSADLLRRQYGVPIWAHAETAAEVKFSIDRLLVDEERLIIDDDEATALKCIHTPGHHPGHLCFFEETGRTLIAGDMIAEGSSILIAHGRGGDMEAYLHSLRRLMTYECACLIPAHGAPLSDPKAALEKQLFHRLDREAKIQAALDSGCTSIPELLAVVYDDVPRERLPLAKYSLMAHLVKLGFTSFDGSDGVS